MKIQFLTAQSQWIVAAIVAIAPLAAQADQPAGETEPASKSGVVRITDNRLKQTGHSDEDSHHHGATSYPDGGECPTCQQGCPDCPEGYQQIGHGVTLTGCGPVDAVKMGLLHVKMCCTKHHLTMKAHCKGEQECPDECKECKEDRHHCKEGRCKLFDKDGRMVLGRNDSYSVVYAAKPDYFDARDAGIYAAEGYGVPMAVPLAPVVGHTYNYGWGVPSSRRTPVSRFVPDVRYIQQAQPQP